MASTEWTITPHDKDPFLNAMQTLFTKEELMLSPMTPGGLRSHYGGDVPAIALQLTQQARHKGLNLA